MAKGRALSLNEWIKRLLSPPAPIVRKARKSIPAYVKLEELGGAIWKLGHMLIVTKTPIVVLKHARMVVAS